MRSKRVLSLIGILASIAMLATACGGDDNKLDSTDSGNQDKGAVVIGSAGFTEIQLMAEMYKLLLDKAGYTSSIKVVQNREVYEPALEKGDIDVVPDYAATMTEFLNLKVNGPDAAATPLASNDKDETVAALNKIGGPLGLKALEAADAVDQNAWIATKEVAAEKGATLSEWEGESIVLASTEECPDRPFCQPGLEKTYGIKVTKNLPLGFGSAQSKEAVTSGKAQLGLTGTTDATLEDLGLVIVEDDKGLQLADNLVPVVGKKYAEDADLVEALNSLASVLTTEDLTALNKKVDGERMKAADVAKEFLTSKGLL